MHVVTVKFEIVEKYAEDFKQAVLKHSRNSLKNEEGCKRFEVSQSPEDPKVFFLYEVYVSEEDFARHRQTDYYKEFFATAGPMVHSRDLSEWNLITAE
ncbi:MAG: putative quinol monooxygenase [bacterium]|jgi:autoinducer 2-degrading protein